MKEDKDDNFFEESKIEDYFEFCDSKQLSGNDQKQSTQNDTDILQKKRERESDESKEKDIEVKKDTSSDKKENNNVFIYSDDECENDLKDNLSSSSYNEKGYFDYDDFNNNQRLEDSDERYNEMMGDLECNDEVFQQNNL